MQRIFPYRTATNILLGIVFGSILCMAVCSKYNSHPDEMYHVGAAEFYKSAWLPPAVGDKRAIASNSDYGTTYLYQFDVCYFFTAKAAKIIKYIITNINYYIQLRVVTAFLFLVMLVMCAFFVKNSCYNSAAFMLLATPQLWYVFSYVNGDAFPFFVSYLIALLLFCREDSKETFFCSTPCSGNWYRGAVLGILIALLLLSKLNYLVFVAFLCTFALYAIFFKSEKQNRFYIFKMWMFVFFVAFCICAPRYIYDVSINDFHKSDKLATWSQAYAKPQYKNGTKGEPPTYYGYNLRSKGVSVASLFQSPWEWQSVSFKSFVGLYGWMKIASPPWYYTMMALLWIFLIGVLFFLFFKNYQSLDVPLLCITFFFILMTIIQSIYNSWCNDFQAQGRYFFPALPLVFVILLQFKNSILERYILPLLNMVFCIAGLTSFVGVALVRILTC